MSIVAQHAFSTLALSAKLHKLLDSMDGGRHRGDHVAFDAELNRTLTTLETGPLREEARLVELELLRKDFEKVEELYRLYKQVGTITPEVGDRLDKVFSGIRGKIEEKRIS